MRLYAKPNMDAGSVRSHTHPTPKRKQQYTRSDEEREWWIDAARRRDRRNQPIEEE